MALLTFTKFGEHGRLGNQLFQYAAMIGFAKKHGSKIVLPNWKYSDYFNDFPKGNIPLVVKNRIKEPAFHYTPEFYDQLNWKEDIDLIGYFQTEKYFLHCKDEVKKALSFKKELIDDLREVNKEIFKKPTIAIHVRRGDYVDNPNYDLLPISYYIHALETHFPDYEKYNIIVFSDNIQYCHVHFQALENVFFANGSEINDLMLLTLCDHFIISNSSYSWWGAYLGEKEHSKIICPKYLFAGKLLEESDISDFYPERFIKCEHKNQWGGIKKIDLTDITFTIPVNFDSRDRKKNLELCVYLLQHFFETNIIIGEQGSNEFLYMGNFCKYMRFANMKEFHRTKMLNEMALASETKYIANWDADVMTSPFTILKAVQRLKKAHFVYPYDGRFARVDRSWFKTIERTADVGWFGTNEFPGMQPDASTSYGGAIMFRKHDFIKAGMENENFISFGPEDYERYERFTKLGFNVERVHSPLYHMQHFVGNNSSTRNPHFQANKEEYKKVKAMTKKQLLSYVKTFSWLEK